MRLAIYQVDAFAEKVFEGNPAAVCPLEAWLDDELLQNIAEANNLSETAFFVPYDGRFQLRWFTPVEEVDLCGHATLAAAYVIFKHFGYATSTIEFDTRSGKLFVEQSAEGLRMDFPASMPTPVFAPQTLTDGLGGLAPQATLAAFDYVVVLHSEEEVRSLKPDFSAWMGLDLRGVVVTAPGKDVDFVSRCFFPKLRVNEDPVTGSAHCEMAPYWGERLGLKHMRARQLSKRSGFVACDLVKDRVILTGKVVEFMQGRITL